MILPKPRRMLIATAFITAPVLVATWMATSAGARPAQSGKVTPAWGKVATALPLDRAIMIVGPDTAAGAHRILTVDGDTHVVSFARSRPDKKYNLISGSQVWLALNQIGPKRDGNYQLVIARDTEGGDARCLSMNSAGQISEEGCEDAERPGEIILGRDVWHFEKRGKKWEIQGFAGYLQAKKRQAGVPKQPFVAPAKKFTVYAAPVKLPGVGD